MKILVTGGGTGGHIYPALALINHIKKVDSNAEFLYVGTEKGLESKIVPKENIPFETVEIQGFRRSLSLENFKTVYLFIKSIKESKKLIRGFNPDIVIGTGGYVSAPVVYAASKLGVKTLIHEQNSAVGVTNKFLSRYVDKVAISFKAAEDSFPKEKVILTGNPRAQDVFETPKTDVLQNYGLDSKKQTVVIFGGSRGALKINQAVVEAIPYLEKLDYQILYASGERYYEEFKKEFDVANQFTNVKIVPYIHDMLNVLANSSLLVGRAGATTIAEFTSLGLPAILIPSPYVTADHQTKNAQSLLQVGAIEMLKDSELTGEVLVQTMNQILTDENRYKQMVEACLNEGFPNASDSILKLVNELV